MSKNNSGGNNVGNGIGFFGALTIAFIVLKLLGKIDWPWIWVLCPIWIPIILVLFILLIIWLIFK